MSVMTINVSMAIRTVLVDLGGTLIDFFGTGNAAQMVPISLRAVRNELFVRDSTTPSLAELEDRWSYRKRDPTDLMVLPLEDRLAFVFKIEPHDHAALERAGRAFMRPLFVQARLFEDAVPFLQNLRSRDLRVVLVSNTTWGSPAHLWREELIRHKLDGYFDGTVFCRDVGWRKPDPRIFQFALAKAGARPSECLFVGDDPVWDVEGPSRLGMTSVLLDRRLEWAGQRFERITNLNDIVEQGMLD